MLHGVALVVAVGFASLAPRIRAKRIQHAVVEDRLKSAENEPTETLVSS